ncbi:geranylgeranyl pyrophosphate synthase [Leifsonia sp. AK011]|uniref:polyprenyl synthetase family protein n=1 Tax=Leifsonia sp. AK011 TaxID=2723075 RepID=UPI0015CCD2E3|nr:polyprenyl synthetase family protein [Leifsonia sp. AK011]NYF10435.1 geranylgeranyl pyrophosphate synthase [Leifsonia sp. AK011]
MESSATSTDTRSGTLSHRVDEAVDRTAHVIASSWSDFEAGLGAFPTEAAHPARLLSEMTGGKYLRSRLAVATYFGLGGTTDAASDAISAAVQLLHLGLCVHDDLIDGDTRRHGRPNVAGRASARALAEGSDTARAAHEAMTASVLAGDLAIARSQQLLLAAPLPAETRIALVDELLDALGTTIGGEWLDVRGETAPAGEVPTDAIAALKTARYTTVLPLRLGAIARGDVDAPTMDALQRYGEALGVAYQMKDDELGIFGDPETTGKSVTADLRSGKRTGLLRLAHELADGNERVVLDNLIGRSSLDEAQAGRLREIFVASGALTVHQERMAVLVRQAIDEVERAPGIPADLTRYLTRGAELVVPRES